MTKRYVLSACEDCGDSPVVLVDKQAGEAECQDCGSLFFLDEEVGA